MHRFCIFLRLTLKKLRYIFVFVFLCGMVFTVIQYLPILEEETPAHRVENKKVKENNFPCDGDADEDDSDPDRDPKADIDYYPVNHFIYVLNYKHVFPHKDENRLQRPSSVTTPPPQS